MVENFGEIYLAGGCFWGVEHYFKQINGVVETSVGYANSSIENPDYRLVCTGVTNSTEAIYIKYDKNIVNLDFLLEMFYKVIDPTSLNKQGNDIGTQYRSGIYYTDVEDLSIIQNSINELAKKYEKKIVVEVQPLESYYSAEEYHQDYLDKNPGGYCHISRDKFEYASKVNRDK